MGAKNADARRRWLFVKKASFFLKTALAAAAVMSALAGYVRFRIEWHTLARENAMLIEKEERLTEEAALAQLRYDEVFSSGRLTEAARKRGFREPRPADYIYESEAPGR